MSKKKKTYKKKYYTGGRLDMSKGGRVKAQVGGIQKAPMSRKVPPMSIEREEEPKELKPIQPVRQPIAQEPPLITVMIAFDPVWHSK